jgi:fucose 4-O-acetylase-like acetyltransferase
MIKFIDKGKKRIEWIDTYRGILILLVVLNHQSLQHMVINESLLAVRMPAFFFISGLLLSDRYTDLKIFATRRFRQLIVPYFIFFLANWLFWVVALIPENTDIITPLKSMLFGCVNTEGGQQNINAAPLWFITTLFMAEMYMFFIKNIFKTTKKILISISILAFLGYLSSNFLSIRMPWNMEIALTALFFYGLGYIVKRENLLTFITKYSKSYTLILFVVSLFIAIVLSLKSMPIYDLNRLGNNAMFTYISALFGIIAMVSLAKLINKNIILEFLGRNTYIILAFHLSSLYFMHGIFKRLGFDFEKTMHSDIWGIIYLSSSIIILIPLIYFINKFTPFILSKK